MKKVAIYILTLLFILSIGFLYAQEDMVEEPAYISFLSGNVDVDLTPDNEVEDFEVAELDMELGAGALIRTGRNALCEITMPDGSTVKISSGSVFQIKSTYINRETGKKSQKFSLFFGKVRAKVQKFMTTDSEFDVVSGTALAGVRGTDYGVVYDGVKSSVLVFDGLVDLKSVTEEFEPVLVSAGQMSFVPKGGVPEPIIDIPEDVLQEWDAEAEKFTTAAAEEVEEVAEEVKEVKKEEVAEKGKGFLEEFLRLNAYVGTITIDDQVYSRWVFTPEVHFGKLKAGLYIPAIFSPDVGIFGFHDWQNHDEWDFRDFGDGLHDFIIKFYYIQWAEIGDPLYVKVGSIDDFFLGHGFIVDNYSNMIYFPEEITVGMQFNVDIGKGGIETMIADFSRLQLFGGRIFARPLGEGFPLAFGGTFVYDRPKPDLALGLIAGTTDEKQLPHILIFGIDVELPVLNLDVFSMKLYADAAKLAYIYQEVPSTPPLGNYVEPGTFGFVKGLGTGIGVMGRAAKIFTYRAEYRYILNYYEPGMINYLWENRRLEYQNELQYLIIEQNDPAYEDTTSAGFMLEGGVILLKKLEFGLGYEDYKRVTSATADPETVKKGKLYVNVYEGLIPKVHGSFSYNRIDNLNTVFQEPFDENTVLDANVIYQLARMIALSFSYNRTFKYNDETGIYDPIDSFGITTIFTFF